MGLMNRYPELSFITSVMEYEEKEVIWECAEELGIKASDTASVLYVYGVSPKVEPLLAWLKEDVTRDIVFIENDLARVAKLQEGSEGDLFKDERIHLKVIMEEEPLEVFAESLVLEFPYENIAFAALKDSDASFERLKVLLMRKSVKTAAYSAEMLHYTTLFENLRANMPLLSKASDVGKWKDAFKGMPAVICGAGPSLAMAKEQIEKMKGHGLVFAGGSAITALSSYHIVPDLLFAIDPNHEEFIRLALHTAFDIPLIYGNRLQPDVMQSFVGDLCYFVSGTGGAIENWFEEELGIEDPKILSGLSDEALSVTAVAIKCALYFGCSPIIFAGIDLSFKKGARYTPGVVSDMQCALEENTTRVSDALIQKGDKLTMTKWLMERDVIQDMIDKNQETTFIDGTGQGLLFDDVEVKLDWESDKYPCRDYKGMVHDLTKSTKLKVTERQVDQAMHKLGHSFDKCHEIITDLLIELERVEKNEEEKEESAKETVLEMDLGDEIAYQVALKWAAYAWGFYIKKACLKENPKRKSLYIKQNLYRKLQSLVEEYQRIC